MSEEIYVVFLKGEPTLAYRDEWRARDYVNDNGGAWEVRRYSLGETIASSEEVGCVAD